MIKNVIKICANKLNKKAICLNISSFTELLKQTSYNSEKDIDFLSNRENLKSGWYGTYGNFKICVSKIVSDNKHFLLSDIDDPDRKSLKDWSEEISFQDFIKENPILIAE